jgi:hypothetical protein
MSQIRQFCCFALVLCLAILPGCGKSLRYEPKELKDLTVVTATHWENKDDVTVLVKQFSDKDNEYYFNKSRLKYVPIQVTVNNRSEHDWVLASEFVNMDLVSVERVFKDMSPSFMRALGMQWIVGPHIGSTYNLRQLDAKGRISKDLAVKTLEQPLIVASKTKGSVVLFVNKRDIKRCLMLKLGHADIPGRSIDFKLLIA